MTSTFKTSFTIFLMVVISSFFSLAVAQDRSNPNEIYLNKKWEYALDGYDATSYFQGDGVPVKGDAQFAAQIGNGTFIFASQENLDLFLTDPDAYRPQYGGHCAYALGKRGFFVKGDPEVYYIEDGRLYLNLKGSIQRKFLKTPTEFITAATPLWDEKFPTSSTPIVAGADTAETAEATLN